MFILRPTGRAPPRGRPLSRTPPPSPVRQSWSFVRCQCASRGGILCQAPVGKGNPLSDASAEEMPCQTLVAGNPLPDASRREIPCRTPEVGRTSKANGIAGTAKGGQREPVPPTCGRDLSTLGSSRRHSAGNLARWLATSLPTPIQNPLAKRGEALPFSSEPPPNTNATCRRLAQVIRAPSRCAPEGSLNWSSGKKHGSRLAKGSVLHVHRVAEVPCEHLPPPSKSTVIPSNPCLPFGTQVENLECRPEPCNL